MSCCDVSVPALYLHQTQLNCSLQWKWHTFSWNEIISHLQLKGSRGLMVKESDSSRAGRNCRWGELMYSALSTLNTTTEVRLSKTPNPQLLPGRRSINGCPLLRVCVHGVCVCSLLCVCTLDGLNAENKFWVWVTILGHMSLHFWQAVSIFYMPPALYFPHSSEISFFVIVLLFVFVMFIFIELTSDQAWSLVSSLSSFVFNCIWIVTQQL